MGKVKYSAECITEQKRQAIDDIHRLRGTGSYAGDMGNICYADGYFAASIKRKYECDSIDKIWDWANS